MQFISLHTHSSFSSGDGHGTPEDMVLRAKELGMSALALTEHGNTSSHVQLEKAANKHGIKPIFGVEAYVADPGMKKKFHQTILATDMDGYRQLNRLVSASWQKNDDKSGFFGKPTVNLDDLFDPEKTSGLIVLSGCASSMLSQSITDGKDTTELVDKYLEVYGDRFYLEVQPFFNYHRTREINQAIEKIHHKTGVPVVATADVHYPRYEDWEVNQVTNAIAWGKTYSDLSTGDRDYSALPGQTFPESDRDMASNLAKTGLSNRVAVAALKETKKVADRCNVTLPKTDPVRFSESDGTDEDAVRLLNKAIVEGITWRKETSKHFAEDWSERRTEYIDRIKKELETIQPKGFSDYFLINRQIITWAKDQGIAVGPARGCLTENSSVLTPKGFTPIKEVKVGEKVWTHEARWRRVEDRFSYPVDESLLKIEAFYGDQGVTLTKDHKVLVKKCERVTNKQKLAQGYRFVSSPQKENEWVRADEVELDDLVMIPIPESRGDVKEQIDLAPYVESRDLISDRTISEFRLDTGEETLIPRFVEVSDLVWLLGAFVSNGWTRKDRGRREVGFATQASKDDGELPSRFKKAFGIPIGLGKKGKTDLHQYRFQSRTLRNFFESLAPGYSWTAQTKNLPEWVHDLSVSDKHSLLEGMWWGDGSRSGRMVYSTSSPALSRHVRLLLWAVGAPAGVRKEVRHDERPEFFGEHTSYAITTTREFNPPKGQNGFLDDKYIYMRVRSIEEVSGVTEVFDLQVEEDRSFTTDSFVVHNSAAASLMCYLLRITEINPMMYPDMLFERFLDPGRDDDPDIDTDYQDDRRHEVFDYARSIYGEDSVGNIGNFSRFRGKSAIKSVAKTLGVPPWEADKYGDYISEAPAGDPREFSTAEDAAAAFPEAREFIEETPGMDLAFRLEGDMRSLGVHAAGMVISNMPISETCAIYERTKTDGEVVEVIAYDKRDASYLNMLKLDCLGLLTMTIVADTIELVNQRQDQQGE